MSLTDLDPTGVLSAAGAAVGLVGAVLRAVPALKNAAVAVKRPSGTGGGLDIHHRAQITPDEATGTGKDPQRERRAYETVNYVLREFGNRICAAGLVDEQALTRALTAATQHIEVNLFSGEANRLFESLAPKLGDPILVNSVFTSIYFIGALTAELSSSLPNYKNSYTPIGPRLVQQLFRTAIGEDAFRENLTANLDAYKTLATTAGLLRPTDIGYSAIPGFPSFSPCRYSSRSFGDVRHSKVLYEKLVRHFDKSGFPQPIASRQTEVGVIKDWRFLSGDSNSRAFDVDKADKNLGENFGKVLHWLICSADRMPPGQAIIAYYDQHIELIKWIGLRMGYSILVAASDLNLSGIHAQLDPRAQSVVKSWVILMASAKAQETRRSISAQWAQSHVRVNVRPVQAAQPHPQPQPASPPILSPASSTLAASGQQNVLSDGSLTGLPESPITTELSILKIHPIHPQITSPASVDQPASQRSTGSALPAELGSSQPSPLSPSSLTSPPPYSPTTSSSPNTQPGFPFHKKRPGTVVRRKAPPPPRKCIIAKALYDFEPDGDDDEELAFREGDEMEIIEKSAALEAEGWCRARVKGGKRLGLAPLEYLQEIIIPVPAQIPASATSKISIASHSQGIDNAVLPMVYQPSPQSLPVSQTDPKPSAVGKLEVAGLSVATIGAATGVASVMQGSGAPGGGNPDGENTITNPSGSAPVPQPPTSDEQNVTVNENASTERVDIGGVQGSDPPLNPGFDPGPFTPPITDLSAFSLPPFKPQAAAHSPNTVAPIVPIDPSADAGNLAVANATAQDSLLYSGTSTSPFVSLASPAPGIATPPEFPILLDDQSSPVIAFTQSDTDYTTAGVDVTGWEAGPVVNMDSYALDDI